MRLVSARVADDDPVAAARWQARVDLAAAHRLAVWHGFAEGIYNHLTLAVPGCDDRYYQLPFGLHWSEATAGCFMEVGYDGRVLAGAGDIERSAYCIHMPVHREVPEHACVLHTHMPFASALARLEDPRLEPIGQTELGFFDIVAYDDSYTGLALEPEEGERLARLMGPARKILSMANHGVLACGRNVAEAYDLLYYFERACQMQLYAMWAGRPLKRLPPAVVDHTLAQYRQPSLYAGKPPHEHHFAALKRLLDRREPDYAS